ncbi:Ribonuclease J (endonuclease and 5' exonuclease) [hydrothermal vent metagenome]|uniref:Ribonuclease J (Endonuclease and 5' exonuclease) n=1 Tax=hydrothermal vent metagenome TaxID=652676 RepID=A0A3B0W352_9ZZZZ
MSIERPFKIIPLGGLGEIGLNMMAMEYDDSIIVVDCGLMFPEDYMLGIDIVIPDVSYLIENREKVVAFILTHGHEDHIGALPFILREVNAPLYGTALTIGFIKNKLEEFGLLEQTSFNVVRPRDVVDIGPFKVEFIRVSHSIVDAVSLAITTDSATVIHTGDFKLDQSPVDGEVTDYARFTHYGEQGVTLLLSDSTNVEKDGVTLSESLVGGYLEEIFRGCDGRIIVAAFSSNIHRVQQVIDAAVKFGRKVVLNGRSMVSNIGIARSLGYLKIKEGVLVDIKDLAGVPARELVLLTTGSQGEPMSALTRMAMDNHKQVKIAKGDTVILSSKFIPGHEKAISSMMNHLYRRGAEVVYEKVSEVHVSGHASSEELKIMLNMVKPKFFIPVHGEYRHLVRHARLAESVGIAEDNIMIIEDGDLVEVTGGRMELAGKVESGRVLVDGKGVGDVKELVLRDRRHLSRDGMVIAVIAINGKTGEIVSGPDIFTRGLVTEEGSEDLLEVARVSVIEAIEAVNAEVRSEQLEVKEEVRLALRRLFNKALKRKPVILPVIIEI